MQLWGQSRGLLLIGIVFAIAGCASTQLNYNTLDLASSVDDLLTSQVVYNLGKFLDDPYATPAQVSIASGSVTTTNQAGVSLTNPLNTAVTTTEQGVVAAGAILPAVTNITSGVRNATTITPTASNQASQNWSLSTDTDSDQVRRLRALYRYATRASGADLCKEYPLLSTQASLVVEVPDPKDKTKPPTTVTYTGYDLGDGPTTITAMDGMFLREPGCIICSVEGNRKNIARMNARHQSCGSDLYINPRLSNTWLATAPLEGYGYIGQYKGTALYTNSMNHYRQFAIFILEATNLGSASGQSGKAGPTVKGNGSGANVNMQGPQILLRGF